MSTPIDVLCKGYPPEFAKYLNYCRSLKFDETPDYKFLRENFRILFRTLNFVFDYVFDWTLLKQKASSLQNQGQAATGATAACASTSAAAVAYGMNQTQYK